MWLAETPGCGIPRLRVALHLLDAQACLIKIALQRGTLEDSRRHPAFHFKDQDDPRNGTRRDFLPELYRLPNDLVEVLRQLL